MSLDRSRRTGSRALLPITVSHRRFSSLSIGRLTHKVFPQGFDINLAYSRCWRNYKRQRPGGVVSSGVAEGVFFAPLNFFLIIALKSRSSFISLAALITFCSARVNIENHRLLPVINSSKSDLQSPAKDRRVKSGYVSRANRCKKTKIYNKAR